MDELKECPFCKSTSNDPFKHKSDCYLRLIVRAYTAPDVDFVSAYNTRPIEDALRAENAALREQQRWIPVGARLPEEPADDDHCTFLCTLERFSFSGEFFRETKALNYWNGKFYSASGTDWTKEVVSWKPLPLPEPEEAEKGKLYRVMFHANADDPRPVVWPVKYPFWVTGQAADDSFATLVSYADSEQYIHANWPDATDVEMCEVASIEFTGRFPRPEWYKDTFSEKQEAEGN